MASILASYFANQNKKPIVPRKSQNYTDQSIDQLESLEDSYQIVSYIEKIFDQPIVVSVYPSGIGGVLFTLEESPRVASVLTWDPDSNLRKILNTNLRLYQKRKSGENTTGKTVITPDYLTETSSLFYYDLIKDRSLDITQLLTTPEVVYIFRTRTIEPPSNPNFSSEVISLSGGTQLIVYLPYQVDPFIEFLDKLLANIIPDPEKRDAFFTDETIVYWNSAFTHKTVSLEQNYETLELLGDRLMKAAFCDYILERIPKITEGELSELTRYYLSKVEQSTLARKLDFGLHIQTVSQITIDIYEDVIEAFIGAIFRVGNIAEKNMGYSYVKAMVVWFYQDEQIEEKIEDIKYGNSKTATRQLLEKVNVWVTDKIDNTGGRVKHEVVIKPEDVKLLKSIGIKLPQILGVGTGRTKTAASTNAYDQALQRLKDNKITAERMEREKYKLFTQSETIAPFMPAIKARLKREGYVDFTFESPISATGVNNAIVQMIGIKPDGSRHIIDTTQATSVPMGKGDLIQRYADQN